MAEAKAIFPKKKVNPTIPIPRTNVREIMAVISNFIFYSSFQTQTFFKSIKNPWMELRHGFKVRSLLWQPGHPLKTGIRGFPSSDYSEFGFFGIFNF
jgi:hypothetical protein